MSKRGPAPRTMEMILLLRQGATRASVARKYGVTHQAVSRLVLKHAPEIVGRAGRPPGPTERTAHMVRRVVAGERQVDVARAYGVTRQAVSQAVRKLVPEASGRRPRVGP